MLREYRIKNGFTLEELAEKCDISYRNLFRIENGSYRFAKFETIAKLLTVLNVSNEDIIEFIKETSK